MNIKSNTIADFLWCLDNAESVEDAFEKLSSVVTTLGFDAISYTLIPTALGVPSRMPPIFITSRDFNAGFLKHYQQANLAQNDFTIRRTLEGYTTALDWELELQKGVLTPQEKDVIDIARYDYGITNAITLPVELNEDLIAGYSLTSSLSRRLFVDLLETNQRVLTLLCQHFHNFVYRRLENRRLFYAPVLAKLNRNERCMLDLVNKGKPLKQSDVLYNIPPSTAGMTLHRLYKKFSIEDRGQLGYLIGRHRLMEMLELNE